MKLINVTTKILTEKTVNFDRGMEPGIVLYKRKIKLCGMKKKSFELFTRKICLGLAMVWSFQI